MKVKYVFYHFFPVSRFQGQSICCRAVCCFLRHLAAEEAVAADETALSSPEGVRYIVADDGVTVYSYPWRLYSIYHECGESLFQCRAASEPCSYQLHSV